MGWFVSRRRLDRYGQTDTELALLHRSDPITPIHSQPQSLDEKGIPYLISEDDRACFEDFREFGIVINGPPLRSTPWRVQERDEVMLILSDYEDPEYGRTYDIFYNAAHVGHLEISAGFDFTNAPGHAYLQAGAVRVQLIVHRPLALPFASLTEFLETLASFLVTRDKTDRAEQAAVTSRAIQSVLWDAAQSDAYGAPLDVQWSGHPTSYLIARNAYRARQGPDDIAASAVLGP